MPLSMRVKNQSSFGGIGKCWATSCTVEGVTATSTASPNIESNIKIMNSRFEESFFLFQKLSAKVLSKDLAYNIDTESLRAFQFQAWDAVVLFTMPGQNRGKPKFPGFHGNIPQEHFKLFNTKNCFWFYCRQTIRKCKNTTSVDLCFLFATKV